MALTPELLQLVQNLRAVRSPVKRMRVLARAWQSFRELDREDRREIARRLGLKGFERVAETIGKRGGMEPEEVETILERVEHLDPSRTGDLIRTLRDPKGRRELARKGIAAIEDQLGFVDDEPDAGQDHRVAGEGMAGAGSEVEPSPAVRAEEPPAPGTRSGLEDVHDRGAVPVGVAASSSAGLAGQARASSPGRKPGPDPDPSRAGVPEPGPSRAVVAPAARPPEPTVEAEPPEEIFLTPALIPPPAAAVLAPVTLERQPSLPEGVAAAVTAGRTDLHQEPRPDRETPTVESLTERIAGARSLVVRLRFLREHIESGGLLDGGGTHDLLALLPDGWARRRALAAVFRSGQPSSFDDALSLLSEIDSASARGWCLTALAQGRPLTAGQLDRLLEMSGTAFIRRRLVAIQSGLTAQDAPS